MEKTIKTPLELNDSIIAKQKKSKKEFLTFCRCIFAPGTKTYLFKSIIIIKKKVL